MTICLIIFALMVIGFFIKQLPMSFTSMAVLVALVVLVGLAGREALCLARECRTLYIA